MQHEKIEKNVGLMIVLSIVLTIALNLFLRR